MTRFGHAGKQADLDRAITVGQEAVDTIPADHPDLLAVLSNLGIALQVRFGRTGRPADLDQAITVGQQAVDAAPADHPGRLLVLSNLGNALRTRFERTGRPADLDRAIAAAQVDSYGLGDQVRCNWHQHSGPFQACP